MTTGFMKTSSRQGCLVKRHASSIPHPHDIPLHCLDVKGSMAYYNSLFDPMFQTTKQGEMITAHENDMFRFTLDARLTDKFIQIFTESVTWMSQEDRINGYNLYYYPILINGEKLGL